MIESRITSKAQTTIPRAVRNALKLRVGDRVVYHVEGETVTLARAPDDRSDAWLDPFATFTEWADEADSAYDILDRR
jgi:antitoxin PrlF